jgi:hypothetical protein
MVYQVVFGGLQILVNKIITAMHPVPGSIDKAFKTAEKIS